MSNEQTAQQQITTFGGTQGVLVYAGTIGEVKYFECRCPQTNNLMGYVGCISKGKYGPLCSNGVSATMRARNISERTMSWWAKIFEFQR